MNMQQETQRDMFERFWAQERERAATEETRWTTKLPKLMLQKLSEKDDVESYLEMLRELPISKHGLKTLRRHRWWTFSLERH